MLSNKLGNIEFIRRKFEKLKLLNKQIALSSISGEASTVLEIRRDELTVEIEELVETIPDEELSEIPF